MRVLFHSGFVKRFKKMPVHIQQSFDQRLRLFMDHPFDPRVSNHSLRGKYHGYRSINITGDYRAIFREIQDDIVEFVQIGTHSELYD